MRSACDGSIGTAIMSDVPSARSIAITASDVTRHGSAKHMSCQVLLKKQPTRSGATLSIVVRWWFWCGVTRYSSGRAKERLVLRDVLGARLHSALHFREARGDHLVGHHRVRGLDRVLGEQVDRLACVGAAHHLESEEHRDVLPLLRGHEE